MAKDNIDLSTEEKIKEAARKVFTQKGYAATRTRDIVQEAGINLALLNYYFRSKEKLFEIIMFEKVQQLFGIILPILNEPSTTLEVKLQKIASTYIDMLIQNPDLPLFVLSEIRNNPEQFGDKLQLTKVINESVLIKQLKEKKPDLNPLHFLFNILGLTIFPFIAKPVFGAAQTFNEEMFVSIVNERKKLIPIWLASMLI
jgi:AcrR family transcriptional regulator